MSWDLCLIDSDKDVGDLGEGGRDEGFSHSVGEDPKVRIHLRAGDASSSSESLGTVCLLYTSPSPRDVEESRMPSSA